MRKGHRNDENKSRSNAEKISVATPNKSAWYRQIDLALIFYLTGRVLRAKALKIREF
jgi:hypothetical protein